MCLKEDKVTLVAFEDRIIEKESRCYFVTNSFGHSTLDGLRAHHWGEAGVIEEFWVSQVQGCAVDDER